MVLYIILNSSPTGTGTCACEVDPSYCSVIRSEISGLSEHESYTCLPNISAHKLSWLYYFNLPIDFKTLYTHVSVVYIFYSQ